MEQLNVLMKCIGCAVATMTGIILIPLGVIACVENGNEFLGKSLTFFWVVYWIFATVFVYNAIFGG